MLLLVVLFLFLHDLIRLLQRIENGLLYFYWLDLFLLFCFLIWNYFMIFLKQQMNSIKDKMTILVDVSNPIWCLEISQSWILCFHSLNAFIHSSQLPLHLKTTTEKPKLKYYWRLSDKLLDSKTSPKSYWSILKIFLNNKKIPCIPPLLHNGSFIIDFKEKAELFNDFFSRQCSLVNNNSKLSSVLN